MNSEKLAILKMLEEKRITAEEAARLLSAIDDKPSDRTFTSSTNKDNSKKTTSQNNWTSSDTTSDRNNTSRNTTSDRNTTSRNNTSDRNTTGRNTTDDNTRRQYKGNQGQNNDEKSFDEMANNLSQKLDILFKDLEPKLSKFSEQVVKTTSDVADKISKSLQKPTPSRATGTYTSKTPSKPNTFGLEQTNIELIVSGNDNQLKLSSLNGDINLKGYNGDKITAKIFYRRKNSHGTVNLVQFGNKYMMDFNEEDFDQISIDAFVPESLFENVILDSVGGRVDIATLKTGNFILENLNGETYLNEIHTENIKINCNNNKLTIKNVTSNIGKIENFNGNISLSNLDIANLKLDAFNSGIDVSILNFNNYTEYMWEITSNNGRISLNLPTSKEIGYYINARTNLSTVKSTLIGLNYSANSESFIEAKSIDYDLAHKKIMIRAETSNAPIAIN